MNSLVIDKKNLFHNYKTIKKLAQDAKICAVVKANAYGHGMDIISEALKNKVDYFAVSTIGEGVLLRQNGITNNILILGYSLVDEIKIAIENDLEVCVGNKEQIKLFVNVAKILNKKLKFHLKKNSGLSRYGYDSKKDLLDILDLISNNLDCLEFVGFFTHFVITDENCESNIERQSKLFEQDVYTVNKMGFHPIVHAASSTTLFLTKGYQYDMVRIGMGFYGFCGFDEKLKKVLTIKSKVVNVREINKNQSIGYGEISKSNAYLRIAVVPMGYGYGIPSKLSQKSHVLINGIKCPIVGNMSMDCMFVDVSKVKEAIQIGSEVIFIGKQKKAEITATDHAEMLNVYSCEILSNLQINRFKKIIKDI